MKNINELYHSGDKLQKRIIDKGNFTYRKILPYLIRYFTNCGRILDLGCGTGTLDFFLSKLNNSIDGYDDSYQAIQIAIKNADKFKLNKKVKFYVKDIEKFTTNRKYNGVLLIEVVEHIKNDTRLIEYAYKILKNNGILILSTRKSNSPLHFLKLTKYHDKRVGHLRRYKIQGLLKSVKSIGFKVLKYEETDGILSDFLFSYPYFGDIIIHVANKITIFGKILSSLDDLLKIIFGSSQIIIISQKL